MMNKESYAAVLESRGVERRDFLKFCSLLGVYMGLSPIMFARMLKAMESKPRIPVIWIHGLECTCCSESFLRSAHPLTSDIILNMISLDYHNTLSAAAGDQLEEVRRQIMKDHKGKYILAVEGNAPTKDGGVYCTINGKTFLHELKETAEDAMAVIAWGSCASFGCVHTAKPNPTGAIPVHKIIRNKPVINVPGCPPIAEVMTGTLAHFLTFGTLPQLDRLKRPKMFYGTRVHDKCYRRPFFDAGMFVENFDDEASSKGWCLYKMGCKGPTTFNSCPTIKWNGGTSYPIQSGHPCIGCSEPEFWDHGPFYTRDASVNFFGVDSDADSLGKLVAGAAAVGVAAHAIGTAVQQKVKSNNNEEG